MAYKANRNLFLTVLEAGKSKIKVPTVCGKENWADRQGGSEERDLEISAYLVSTGPSYTFTTTSITIVAVSTS